MPTSRMKLSLLVLAVLASPANEAWSQGTVLTFDDLPLNAFNAVPNGYGGVQWANFWYFDGVHMELQSGYINAVVSPDLVVAGGGTGDDGQLMPSTLWGVPFNLESGYLTAAFNDGLQVEVQGYVHGNLIYDGFYSVDPTSPSFIQFGYLGVDEVRFYSSGGTQHIGFSHSADFFVLDNLSVTVVPEPSSFALSMLSIGLLAVLRRRKMNSQANQGMRDPK